ncbi:unnamed protein product, partial [Vitis vinifera]|uniref:Uncharacterized protein n=1 Tax=Vitis vinifera TaxID=29760 RepID=D7TFQ2_VITVI
MQLLYGCQGPSFLMLDKHVPFDLEDPLSCLSYQNHISGNHYTF